MDTLIQAILSDHLPELSFSYKIVSDATQAGWETVLTRLADEEEVSLVLTTGGIDPVGFVPDATVAVCNKLFPGFGTIIRQAVLPTNPAALLWRNTAGLRNQTLIVNLPDSVETIRVGLPLLFPAIPNAIRLAKG
ncbi:MAG: molybdopterin adenylyltransferase [Rudanella sp.]|nr:molybdopterin adenylyltransferase [Rudanella sp.]